MVLPALSFSSILSAVDVLVFPLVSFNSLDVGVLVLVLPSLSLIVMVSPFMVVVAPSLPFTPMAPCPSFAVMEMPSLPSLPLTAKAPLPSLPTVADTTSLPSAFFTIIAPSLAGVTSAFGTGFALGFGCFVTGSMSDSL